MENEILSLIGGAVAGRKDSWAYCRLLRAGHHSLRSALKTSGTFSTSASEHWAARIDAAGHRPVNKSPMLTDIEGRRVKITGRIELYKGKPEFESMLPLSLRMNDLLYG
jgi:hypothetical protein